MDKSMYPLWAARLAAFAARTAISLVPGPGARIRKLAALAALATLGAGALCGGASADPAPLPPDQAEAAVNSGMTHPASVTGIVISPAEVALATGEPAAAPLPDSPCWYTESLWTQWGTWPYQQRVTEYRYWCANGWGGPQTTRTSSVHLGSTLCSHHDPWQWRVSGGNGFTWTVVRTGGSFDCPTAIPWVIIHTDRWQDWSCNTWGNCSWVRGS
jgi:hypothetical protein